MKTNFKKIIKNEEIKMFIEKGNSILNTFGYNDHSAKHTLLVARRAGMIMNKFGYTEHDADLARIAGYMHDIGNAVNRKAHAEYGAVLANELLKKTDLTAEDRITVVSAIAHHDESTGGAYDAVSAALIIADKTDVRRNRVTQEDRTKFDKHDCVNYAVTDSALKINLKKKQISLNLQIDESICTMYEYFDIFLGRMQMCRQAAAFFGTEFRLTANGSKVL